MKKIISCFLICIILIHCTSCSRVHETVERSALFFDTFITITIYDTDVTEAKKESLLSQCITLCSHYESLFSKTIPDSDVWKINHAEGNSVTVDSETAFLLNTALYYCELTDGRIDPTIESVASLWDFRSAEHSIPSDSDLTKALTHVGYQNLKIQNNEVTLSDPDASLDLGFIAKGYIADQIKAYLVSEGITSAMINLGGNILLIGSRTDHSDFLLGIQYPFWDTGEAICTIQLSDCSLVTSGIYERCFTLNDTLYHHILDTETGYPVQNNLYSVSIICDSSMQADALSTTCFVLGLDQGMNLIQSLEQVDAIFVLSDYSIVCPENSKLSYEAQ